MSNIKPHMLQFIEQLLDTADEKNMEWAPENLFLMLATVNDLGPDFDFKTSRQIQSIKLILRKQ